MRTSTKEPLDDVMTRVALIGQSVNSCTFEIVKNLISFMEVDYVVLGVNLCVGLWSL
jgi:hypothetical protein